MILLLFATLLDNILKILLFVFIKFFGVFWMVYYCHPGRSFNSYSLGIKINDKFFFLFQLM